MAHQQELSHGNIAPKPGLREELELEDLNKSHVPSKYRGTEADQAQMRTMGRLQETRRNFTFVTMLGFGSTLICTWEVVLANIGSVLTNGGTAGLFWCAALPCCWRLCED